MRDHPNSPTRILHSHRQAPAVAKHPSQLYFGSTRWSPKARETTKILRSSPPLPPPHCPPREFHVAALVFPPKQTRYNFHLRRVLVSPFLPIQKLFGRCDRPPARAPLAPPQPPPQPPPTHKPAE